jgi:N-sulfoglucosamine sulfohydrolase
MFGHGRLFDEYTPTSGDGFYEKHMRGEEVNAGWVNPTDFERELITRGALPPG